MISGDQEASAALNNNVDEVSVPIPNLLSTPERSVCSDQRIILALRTETTRIC